MCTCVCVRACVCACVAAVLPKPLPFCSNGVGEVWGVDILKQKIQVGW